MTIEDAIQLLTEAKVALADVQHYDPSSQSWDALVRVCTDSQKRIADAIVRHQQARDGTRRIVAVTPPGVRPKCECQPVRGIGTAVRWRGDESFCRECGLFVAAREKPEKPSLLAKAMAAVRDERGPSPLFPRKSVSDRPYPYSRDGGWDGPCTVCGKADAFWRGWGREPDPNRFCDGPTDWMQTDVHMTPEGETCKGTGMLIREFDALDWVKASRAEMTAKSKAYRLKQEAAERAARRSKP